MPFLLSPEAKKLLRHVAKQNPQHSEMSGQEVLVTLQGPHDYISPTWYSSPGVPTWNDQAVHVYGLCSVFDDSDRLKELGDGLTSKYEAAFSEPWRPEYKPSMLGAITGIQISINEIQCKYKLSQNRSIQDQKQVINALEKLGASALAEAMGHNP
ncbi:MAG: transcriptional regulator [Halioglobus sp.]|jgi:transcriptional regulator